MKRFCSPVLIAALLLGCAGEDDIDRTQANRLPKSMFQGTWYMRSTVIDVPGTSTISWTGATTSLEKVRWDIQEKWLIAYRAYEEVPGTDTADREQGSDASQYRENPLAVFPIESHFDIKRDYNPTTGEQRNVIEENTTDRPWHQREWIRVNWAHNELHGKWFSGVGGRVNAGAEFYVQPHEDDSLALRVEDKEGNPIDFESLSTVRNNGTERWGRDVHYFDAVRAYLLEPEQVTFGSGGREVSFPLCWFIRYRGANFQTASCGPTEVKLRTAFMKVGERNFEPVPLRNREMGKFGYFRTERFTWDRHYGFTETGRIYLANVHNIWEAAYETEADGSLKVGSDGKFVSIPLSQRIPKPLVYYLNSDFPCELVATARQTAESWNKALRRTVAVAKGLLTKTTGDIDKDLEGISTDQVPNMFKLSLNGWAQKTAGDDWSCDNLEIDQSQVVAQLGDLRYNFMAWVPDRQITGPLGYGPSSSDPETGEIIAGMAYVYGAAMDRQATSALDIVRILNDDLDIDELSTGQYVRDYIAANQLQIDPAKIPAEAARLRGKAIRDRLLPKRYQLKLAALRDNGLEPARAVAKPGPLEQLRGTRFEPYLTDDEIARAQSTTIDVARAQNAGMSAATPDASQLTPVDWASREALAMDQLRHDRAASRTLWLAEFADDAILGFADELWKKYGKSKDYDAMWQEIRELIFRGVMDHEVGHTLGLRHNFAGSFDSLNYFNHYWDLRAKPDSDGNGGMIQRDPLVADSNNQLSFGELYRQAKQTDAQIKGRMREYQYSSIMDYHAKFNSDVHGIGKYDEAAILFAYGGYVEVFDNIDRAAKAVLRQRYSDCLPRYESIPNPAFDYLLEQWHYSSIWNLLGGNEKLKTRRFRPWSAVKKEQHDGTQGCKEYIANGGSNVSEYVDREDSVRDAEVPYMFCGDEYVGATQSCQRWDQGADPYEQVSNVVRSYRSYYFFNNFKRDRFPFDPLTVYRRIAGRYFSYLPNTYQHWLFETQFGSVQDQTQDNYWTIATLSGFNLLMDAISRPEYGTYCKFDPDTGDCDENGPRWGLINSDTTAIDRSNRLVIPRGDGRRRFSRFDYESGYNYQYQVLESGHFWENLAALQALTSSVGTFVGREVASDFTTYLVPYYLMFDEELTRYFDGVITEDYASYAHLRLAGDQVRMMPAAPLELAKSDSDETLFLDPETGQEIADPQGGDVIDLNNWFTLKFYTLVLGMSEFRSAYSLRYADRQQIFRVGSGEQVTPAGGKQPLTCEDPVGKHIYGTIDDESSDKADQGGAVKMINQCNEDVAAYLANPDSDRTKVRLNDTIEWLNFMRGLYDIFGNNVF